MGVKLSELLPKKEISFDDLANKKIAIDFSNSAFQFLSSIRQQDGTPLMDSNGKITSHLMGIWTRFTNLMLRNTKLVIVFDGKAPILKIKEQEERAYRKQVALEKFEQAKEKEDTREMLKYAKQAVFLTKDMIKESKELINALGLPIIQSPSESDAQMALLNERNDVWACASSDHDCLIQGAPRLITNLTLSQRRKLPSGTYINITPELIELKHLLKKLKINQDQLIALAILVGTDYNIGGVHRIGPKTALKLVQQTKKFDKLFKDVNADFNWKQIFAIYKNMPVIKSYRLKWTQPDAEKIKKILVDKHDFSEERIDKNLSKLLKYKIKKDQKGLSSWF